MGDNNLFKIIIIAVTAMAAALIIFVAAMAIRKFIWNRRIKRRKQLIKLQEKDEKTIALGDFSKDTEIISAYGSQILGTREDQQDSFFVSGEKTEFDLLGKSYIAASVCDGMGGLTSGSAASQMAVEIIKNKFYRQIAEGEIQNIPKFLHEVAVEADEAVYNFGQNECGGQMCGTTLTFALVENNLLYWLSVGDSRIYVIRGDEIAQITNDHNYLYLLNQRLEQEIITQKELDDAANKEALISYIGMGGLDVIDLSEAPLRLEKGDIVLLCSDGLTKVLSEQDIKSFVKQNKRNPEKIAKELPAYSFEMNRGPSQDNTTVALVCYE